MLASAGCAVVHVDAHGNLVLTVIAVIPSSFPQTGAAAERLAVLVANRCVSPLFSESLVVDCKGGMPLISNNRSMRSGGSLWFGIARQIAVDGIKIHSVRWTKAHRLSASEDPADAIDFAASTP